MAYNNKLYELRKQKGFSQEELANRLNVSRQTISKWEIGETTPEMEKLMALSELYEISIDEMVFEATKANTCNEHNQDEITMAKLLESKVLTSNNKDLLKKVLKIIGVGVAIIFAIDLISMIVYISINGFPG